MTFNDENARLTLCLANKCCEGPVDPVLMRRFFKTAIKAHWENPTNHGRYEDVLGCYGLDENSKMPLTIMVANEDMTGEKVSYPRIVLKVGDSNVQKHVLGNEGEYSADNASLETAWQIDTSIRVTHIFQDADVAYAAAQSTFEFLAAFSGEWRSVLGLQLFDPVSVSEEKIEKPIPEGYFRVDATFKLNYNFVITVNTESHRLKVIAHDVTIK